MRKILHVPKYRKNQRKGISLIVTISLMLVLSVMGVTFVQMSTNDRIAAENFSASVDAQLTAYAGLDHAVAVMFEQLRTEEFDMGVGANLNHNGIIPWKEDLDSRADVHSQLLYPPPTAVSGLQNQDGDAHQGTERNLFRASQQDPSRAANNQKPQVISLYNGEIHDGLFSHSGVVGREVNGRVIGRFEENGNFYALKIADSSGQFNVNSHIATNINASGDLSPNGARQGDSQRIFLSILGTLAEECGLANNVAQAISNRIQAFRESSGAGNFPRRFQSIDEVRDIVEEESERLLGAAFNNEANVTSRENFLSNLCVNSFIDTTTVGADRSNPGATISTPSSYYFEQRAPVNVNTASRELLIAVIKNVLATATLYVSDVEISDSADTSFTEFGQTSNNALKQISTETTLINNPTEFVINFAENNGTAAENLADEIIGHIENVEIFQDRGEFERFLDNLVGDNNLFPTNPASGTIQDETWNQACIDALKSNFNPNGNTNFWNPNAGIRKRVGKGDLFVNSGSANVPTHTVELTFFNVSSVQITSIARVTSNRGTRVLATAGISSDVDFGTVLRHTSQQDFALGNDDVNFNIDSTAVSFPSNLLFNKGDSDANVPHPQIGGVEPRPFTINFPSTGLLYQSSELFTEDFDNTTGTGRVKEKTPPPTNPDVIPMEARTGAESNHNLGYDGLVSRKVFYEGGAARYFVETAFDQNITPENIDNASRGSRNNPVLTTESTLRQGNTNSSSNVGNFKGAIEFWFKPEVDESDDIDGEETGVPSGILGVTTSSQFLDGQPVPGVSLNTHFREGVQMYLYRNTLGILRLSRLYYAFCFTDPSSGQPQPYGAAFPTDVDGRNRKLARRDVSVDTSDWKAGEWHHIRITWDDRQTGNSSLRLFVDDEESNNFIKTDNPTLDVEWAVLNEREPFDGFFINGFKRDQLQRGGFFHFAQKVDYFGNCTIDNIISHEDISSFNSNSAVRTYRRQRFEANATYTNTITAPRDGILTAVRWTSYPSFQSTGSDEPRVELVTLTSNDQGDPSFVLPDFPASNFGSGTKREVAIPNGDETEGFRFVEEGENITYAFRFTNVEDSTIANGRHVCAALDSVSFVLLNKIPVVNNLKFF